MIVGPEGTTMKKMTLVIGIMAAALLGQTGHSLAQDQPLARLIELVRDKGYKDASLGYLCQQFSIVIPLCKGYRIIDDEANPRPSFSTLRDSDGVDHVILAIHDDKTGFAYLTSASGRLNAASGGIKINGTNDWKWERIPITDEIRAGYQKQFDYWKKHEEEVATVPDRPSQ
jgi:hypothetical protein